MNNAGKRAADIAADNTTCGSTDIADSASSTEVKSHICKGLQWAEVNARILRLELVVDSLHFRRFAIPAFQKGIAYQFLTLAVHLLDALDAQVVEAELGHGILHLITKELLREQPCHELVAQRADKENAVCQQLTLTAEEQQHNERESKDFDDSAEIL